MVDCKSSAEATDPTTYVGICRSGASIAESQVFCPRLSAIPPPSTPGESKLMVVRAEMADKATAKAPTPGTPQAMATNVCAACRSQKRKCDKRLPSCSRCLRFQAECNYDWYHAEQQVNIPNSLNPQTSLSDFLLFHVPVTGDQHWLPGTFQPLQPCRQNIHSRALDIDRFLVGVVTTTLAEQSESLGRVINAYFTNVHSWLPVIHEQSFRARLSPPSGTSQAETGLLFLAMFLLMGGGGSQESTNESPKSRLHLLCNYLFSFLQLVRGPSLELVQAGLLLAVYQVGSGRSQDASLSIGACARLGYILRLNFDSLQQPQGISWVMAEEQRRVWLGVYMLDRLIHQVVTDPAPHAVDEPPIDFRLPVADGEWQGDPECPPREFFQPSFSTPIDINLSYFAREIQAIRILGQVQRLPRLTDHQVFLQNIDTLDSYLLLFMEHLFEQTPGSWEVLCGANATALLAAITLHRTRISFESQIMPQSRTTYQPSERSIFALCSIVHMVTDICIKFNALDPQNRTQCVPLPAVICTVEAARSAVWLNQFLDGRSRLDIDPLWRTLDYAAGSWGLAGVSSTA